MFKDNVEGVKSKAEKVKLIAKRLKQKAQCGVSNQSLNLITLDFSLITDN